MEISSSKSAVPEKKVSVMAHSKMLHLIVLRYMILVYFLNRFQTKVLLLPTTWLWFLFRGLLIIQRRIFFMLPTPRIMLWGMCIYVCMYVCPLCGLYGNKNLMLFDLGHEYNVLYSSSCYWLFFLGRLILSVRLCGLWLATELKAQTTKVEEKEPYRQETWLDVFLLRG